MIAVLGMIFIIWLETKHSSSGKYFILSMICIIISNFFGEIA